ncbi:hypothetical protein GCM10011380_07710 [Sphingomonas metalli]|uniref:Methyltransferase small domain-containing protein n=1 Tax=Sphingomonas metalli TaxID=1779358 RepID=A0A916SZD8_9SPHN|nr:methyltransferase [Sphingomonas metalli]GGB20586.1 hypothetical protein GCM10011380_07710 [Sphingomonas metalli]
MLTDIKPASAATAGDHERWFAPERRAALLDLLRQLDAHGYDFVTATPATHRRVLARPGRQQAGALRDVLSWSLPFAPDLLDAEMLAALEAAGAVRALPGGRLAATLRVSRVEGRLFLHSAYPTLAQDSVFLGPDSHRFARWIAARLLPDAERILDYGAGAGVGGISAAGLVRRPHLTLADINPKALFLAGINADHAGIAHDTIKVAEPRAIAQRFDLIVTHPPFMIDAERRAYRDGGDLYGTRLSLEWVMQGLDLLAPGGRLILHTGVSIVDGRDVLREALRERLPAIGFGLDYEELDPDIFSEDLDQPGYAAVERISAIGLVVRRVD